MGFAEPHSSYLLMDHVHTCHVNNHLVFLDLRRDKYCCLNREDSESVIPVLQCAGNVQSIAPRASEVLQSLADSKLLTTGEGRALACAAIQRATHDLSFATHASAMKSDIPRFLISAGIASLRLRYSGIEEIIDSVKRRKKKRGNRRISHSMDSIRESVCAFKSLRPFFPKRYVCLFDSFALLEFLALDSLFPMWVFGVKMDPFGAHCWLQQDDVVLNDNFEYVREFTPIMAV